MNINTVMNLSIFVSGLIVSTAVANCLDPKGSQVQRPLFKRFLTITLPDNAPMAFMLWTARVTNWTALANPEGVAAIAILVLPFAKLLEYVRYVAAWALNKIPSIGKELAMLIAPRDYRAIPVNS